jgi:hypothetical protein
MAIEWTISNADSDCVKQNSSIFLLGISTIDNLSITYLSQTKIFIFQEEFNQVNFQRACLRVISTLKIPAFSGLPIKLGTTLGKKQEPMPMVYRQSQQLQVWGLLTYLNNQAW